MKRIIILLLISNAIGLYCAPTQTQINDIREKVGAQIFSTLSPHQIQRMADITLTLSPNQLQRFYSNLNYHHNKTNKSKQRDIVKVKLNHLKYRESSEITHKDTDRVISNAYKHATT